MANRNIPVKVLVTVFLLSTAFQTEAQHNSDGKFNPGTFILDHIGDAYDWHILTFNGHHVSVPLPVILYSRQTGFHMFMSSRFHDESHTYRGFTVATDGAHKGKIVEQAAGGSWVRPALDISITKNVFAIFVSMGIILWVFISIAKVYVRRGSNRPPKGLQSLVEPVILFVRDDVARPAIGHKYERFMPYLLTIFFFILINNLMGLIPFFPFGANVTGNIAITLVLALLTFFVTIFSANKNYWLHIVNTPGVPWWLKFPLPLMPFIELVGLFTKPVVLMIRLFANISAGHIIAIGFFSLIFIFGALTPAMGYGVSIISIIFTVFMTLLELLVAFIQAYVFTLLSALYFGMAIEEHH